MVKSLCGSDTTCKRHSIYQRDTHSFQHNRILSTALMDVTALLASHLVGTWSRNTDAGNICMHLCSHPLENLQEKHATSFIVKQATSFRVFPAGQADPVRSSITLPLCVRTVLFSPHSPSPFKCVCETEAGCFLGPHFQLARGKDDEIPGEWEGAYECHCRPCT